jgi:hypothetical protein
MWNVLGTLFSFIPWEFPLFVMRFTFVPLLFTFSCTRLSCISQFYTVFSFFSNSQTFFSPSLARGPGTHTHTHHTHTHHTHKHITHTHHTHHTHTTHTHITHTTHTHTSHTHTYYTLHTRITHHTHITHTTHTSHTNHTHIPHTRNYSLHILKFRPSINHIFPPLFPFTLYLPHTSSLSLFCTCMAAAMKARTNCDAVGSQDVSWALLYVFVISAAPIQKWGILSACQRSHTKSPSVLKTGVYKPRT